LAIIALIAVPNITGYVKTAQEGKFEASVDSLINAYRYKQIDEGDDIGRMSTCSLDVEKCDISGYVEKCEDKICVYITDGRYCAIGTANDYAVREGDCSNSSDEPLTPPVITNITVANQTVSSATIIVNFTEPNFVVSHKYRLLDRNNNVVVDWTSGDSINNLNLEKSSSKTFTGLEKGTEYKVEVEIVNNNPSNNKATSSKTFTTINFNAPTITYDSSRWETVKSVTITYPTLEGVDKKYRILTNNRWDYSGTIDASQVQYVTIVNNHYYVEAKASSGSSVLTRSYQIGFIDNSQDENNTKPTIEALNYKNGSGINTNAIKNPGILTIALVS